MTDIAFIDVDRIVANGDARFAKAEQIANAQFAPQSRDWKDAYWHVAFSPENIALDVLIDGAPEHLNEIEEDYEILFLTSRPEHMREATRDWLNMHGIGVGRDLLMKPSVFKYTKTVLWKAGTIHQTAAMYGARQILVIDDEQMNLDELLRYPAPFSIKCFTSLEMKAPYPDFPQDMPDNPF